MVPNVPVPGPLSSAAPPGSMVPAEARLRLSPAQMRAEVVRLLELRGVSLEAVAQVVQAVQDPYLPNLSLEECLSGVESVVEKREVQHAVLTGVALDALAEQGRLPEPLGTILRCDDSLYGVDEVLALAITNVYGSIGLTNFGYLDKVKLGIIGELNRRKGGQVHTFLDDLVAAIAAAAAARIAHQRAWEPPAAGPGRRFGPQKQGE